MDVKRIFGTNLQECRKKANLSQEQLAELVGITQKHLSSLETGKAFVSAELLERISQELNASVSALFYTPEEKSLDESTLSNIDHIIGKELEKASISIRTQIHKFDSHCNPESPSE